MEIFNGLYPLSGWFVFPSNYLLRYFIENICCVFVRSIDYSINECYSSHVTVFAEVVNVALDLSTKELMLKPNSPVMPVEHGNLFVNSYYASYQVILCKYYPMYDVFML